MPYLQMKKGSWRVRRPIPKMLQPYLNRGAYLTETLRRQGEPKLTNRAEADRRSIPVIAKFQAMLDRAAANHAILYGEIELTVIKTPVEVGPYRLSDPNDPHSPIVPDRIVMVEEFVRKADLTPVGPITPPAPLGVTYDAMITGWADENHKGTKARQDAKTKCDRFIAFVGHDDMTRVTFSDCVAFKDMLVAEMTAGKRASNSIKNHLIALRAVFGYAAQNGKLNQTNTNPWSGVKFNAKKGRERRDYTPQEREQILIASRHQEPTIKWLGWIPAFTGCRIEEIADATTADVKCIQGIWCIRIREDKREQGQTIKTQGSVRTVPLHSAILAEKFLEYVQSLPPGPLFPKLQLDCYGRRSGPASHKIQRFIRKTCGITNPLIAPSHSWRHTIATILADVGVPLHHIAGITGHIVPGVIADYLHPKITEMKKAIEDHLPAVAEVGLP